MPVVLEEREVPAVLRSISPLDRTDYEECFAVKTDRARSRTPEQWARSALEGVSMMRFAPTFWRLLGLDLGPIPSPDHVAGWRIADSSDDWIRLELRSFYATIHVVIRLEDDRVQESMFIRYDRPIARFIWAPVSVFHRRAMPRILRGSLRA